MSTMPVQSFYPDFVPNQILTNIQLNDLRRFLDEQNRLTRIRLVGTGIVCGLRATVTMNGANATISISEGYGITSDGYLLEIPNLDLIRKRKYTDKHREKYILDGTDKEVEGPVYLPWRIPDDQVNQVQDNPETQRDIWELFTQDDLLADPAMQTTYVKPADWTGRVLVLYLEMNFQELKSCLTTDCNNKGKNLNFIVRPLLVNETDLTPVEACTPWKDPFFVPRFNRGLRQLGKTSLSEIDSVQNITDAYANIISAVKTPLFAKIKSAYQAHAAFLDLKVDMVAIENKWIADLATATPDQYHYDYLKDVAAAYNEFVKHICSLVEICCPQGDFPRHLMIRDFVEKPAPYRHEFMPSPVRNVMHHDLQKAEKLFLRLVQLIESFKYLHDVKSRPLKITPSQTEMYPLGTRTIPHYYDLPFSNPSTAKLWSLWQPQGCCSEPWLLSYRENNPNSDLVAPNASDHDFPVDDYQTIPMESLLTGKSFLRIEGQLGNHYTVVSDLVKQYRAYFNLDFDFRVLRIGTGQHLPVPPSPMDDHLIQALTEREKLQRSWEIKIMAGQKEEAAAIQNEITELNVKIQQMNEAWARERKVDCASCGYEHLQADYMSLRSEIIATYSKMLRLLDGFLPEIFDAGSGTTNPKVDIKMVKATRLEKAARLAEVDNNLKANPKVDKKIVLERERVTLRRELDQLARFEKTLELGQLLVQKRTIPGTEGVSRMVPALQGADSQVILSGLMFGLGNLRRELRALLSLLPKDVVAFNYTLFIHAWKEVHSTLIYLKLLFSVLGELITLQLGGLSLYLNWLRAVLLKQFVAQSPVISDWLTGLLRIEINNFHVRSAAIFYQLEYLRKHATESFSSVACKHPGMEHLAGVEPGGTFFVVCDANGMVVADFSLRGSAGCCCDPDPANLCLPPVAMPDFYIEAVKFGPDDKRKEVRLLIDVLKNDYDLDDNQNIDLRLPEEQSQLGGTLKVITDENGKRLVEYTRLSEQYAIDSFRYELFDEDCQLSDQNEVLILVKPQTENPIIAQEDYAATTLNQSVDIDVALNDLPIAGSDVPFTLNLEGNPTHGGIVTVRTAGGRPIFNYAPPEGFTGRDIFFYQIKSGEVTARGMVTVLITPCCDKDNAGDVLVVGRDIRGIVMDNNRAPIIGTTVRLQRSNGETFAAVTDVQGLFVLRNMAPGDYILSVSVAGYLAKNLVLRVDAGAPVVTIDVVLQPIVIVFPGGILTDMNFVKLTASVAGVTPSAAYGTAVFDTFNNRHTERLNFLDSQKDTRGIGDTAAFAKAGAFMTTTIPDAEKPAVEIAAEYETLIDTLVEAHKVAVGETKETYKLLLENVTHAFMDKMILENPNKSDEAMQSALTKATKKMKEAGLSPAGLKNKYGGGKLESDLGIGIIKEMNKILR